MNKLSEITGTASFLRRNPHLPAAAGLAEQCEATPEVKAMTTRVKNERDLHDQCEAYFKSKGWCYFHGSMAHRQYRTLGEPDWICAADNGVTYWVECKAGDGKLSQEQQAIKAWLLKLGHRYILARSIEDVIAGVR